MSTQKAQKLLLLNDVTGQTGKGRSMAPPLTLIQLASMFKEQKKLGLPEAKHTDVAIDFIDADKGK